MIKIFKTFFICGVTFCLASNFISCSKNSSSSKNPEDIVNFQTETITETEGTSDWIPASKWNYSHKKIVVVFGYGYNEENFTTQSKEILGNRFGLAEENGLILPLVFPDDFKVGMRNRISKLSELLDDYEISGVILLGAPEDTHKAVANLRKKYDNAAPFPIFSFFPQDDVMGTEYSSDFVLERMTNQESSTETEVGQNPEQVFPILVNAIRYISYLDGPLPIDENLIRHVQAICGSNTKITNYVDPESGLRSANHFVYQEISKQ